MNSYLEFQKQLSSTVISYPNLKILEKDNLSYLRGILDVPNDKGEVVGSFLIEIHFKAGFPYRFPLLFEVGGTIPNHPDWHKYQDSCCCITVLPDEILKCRAGITLDYFIQSYAIPFLANYLYRVEKGSYLNGEYSHGPEGLSQFYENLFKTNDKKSWIEYFEYAFRHKRLPCGRNEICFCGEKKFKNCHLLIFDNLRLIKEEQVLSDFKLLIK